MVSVSPIDKSRKKMTRTMLETDLRELSVSKRRSLLPRLLDSLDRVLFLGSGFDEIMVDEECDVVGVRDWKLGGVVVGGGARYSGGGSLTGGGDGREGGSGGGDGDGSSRDWDSNHGNNIMEEYYQKMIDAYPGDALLLSNYAKFLKEIADSYFTLLRRKPYSWYSLQQKKGLGGATPNNINESKDMIQGLLQVSLSATAILILKRLNA
ncbi:uncharacterized protein LOC114303391 [Camellia sinensis]|uniref:uncharacterized protein LOC114303391 n=1 Tax=Camellia sinensis TaxID=4442 RepID=UPI001036F0DD|nr:uncharacterized protein LOC114303391 [Camellia sinensis]